MKQLLTYFIFLIITINYYEYTNQIKIKVNNLNIKENNNNKKNKDDNNNIDNKIDHNPFPKNLLKCKICQNLINYEFNFEKLLEDNYKIESIKKIFLKFPIKEINFNLSKENLEKYSKEISMEYFFKGEEAIISSLKNTSKFNKFNRFTRFNKINKINKIILKLSEKDIAKFFEKCKKKKIKSNINCDILKIKFCENLIGTEENTCIDNKLFRQENDNDNDNDNENQNKNQITKLNKNLNKNLNIDKENNKEINKENNKDITNINGLKEYKNKKENKKDNEIEIAQSSLIQGLLNREDYNDNYNFKNNELNNLLIQLKENQKQKKKPINNKYKSNNFFNYNKSNKEIELLNLLKTKLKINNDNNININLNKRNKYSNNINRIKKYNNSKYNPLLNPLMENKGKKIK
jgi:hypothetical protein